MQACCEREGIAKWMIVAVPDEKERKELDDTMAGSAPELSC